MVQGIQDKDLLLSARFVQLKAGGSGRCPRGEGRWLLRVGDVPRDVQDLRFQPESRHLLEGPGVTGLGLHFREGRHHLLP